MIRHSTTNGDYESRLAGRSLTAVGAYSGRDESQLAEMSLWAAGIPYVIDAGEAAGVRLLVGEPDSADARWALTYSPQPVLATSV